MADMTSEQRLQNELDTITAKAQISEVIWATFAVSMSVFVLTVFIIGLFSHARRSRIPEDIELGEVPANIGRARSSRQRSRSGSRVASDESLRPTRHWWKSVCALFSRSNKESDGSASQPTRSLESPNIQPEQPAAEFREQIFAIPAEQALDFQAASGKTPGLPRYHNSRSGGSKQKVTKAPKRRPRFKEGFGITGKFTNVESAGADGHLRAKNSPKFTPDPIHPVARALEVYEVDRPGSSDHAPAHEQHQYMMAGALQPVSKLEGLIESDELILNTAESVTDEAEEWENFDDANQRDGNQGGRELPSPEIKPGPTGDAAEAVTADRAGSDEQKPATKSESQEADTFVVGGDDASISNDNLVTEKTFV
jgi:hypothetical protein